jgi:hypothetical protein
MNLLQGVAFVSGSVFVGGPLVLAATLIERQALCIVCGIAGGLVGLASAVAGSVVVGRWFRRRIPAACPECGGPAFATTEGRMTRFRCDVCGSLSWPAFVEGR